jgi:hypothetical protein
MKYKVSATVSEFAALKLQEGVRTRKFKNKSKFVDRAIMVYNFNEEVLDEDEL